jgi:hypothetical protein
MNVQVWGLKAGIVPGSDTTDGAIASPKFQGVRLGLRVKFF